MRGELAQAIVSGVALV